MRSEPHGFTLLEIMVAMAIIAIVLVAVYKMHHQTIDMNNAASFHTRAPLLAQKKIAEIKSRTLNDIADDEGDFGEDFADYHWQVTVEDVESELLGDAARRLKKIDMTVSHDQDEMTYQIRSYIFF
ncbi:MAG: prepilin-type N-terminal cleavage/methylation domain-containing protein [Desulfobacterales bacterium]